MAKKVLVLLAGSGAKDGSEINESVLLLTNLSKVGIDYQCVAPDKRQQDVINFIDGSSMEEKRNVLIESARIARGDIKNLSEESMNNYDALVIPGGFGVAKNLCDFANSGPEAEVDFDAKRVIQEAFKAQKPIMAICIAPALVALSLQELQKGIKLTLGLNKEPNEVLAKMSAEPCPCPSTDFVVDEKNKIISSPAFMNQASLAELDQGIGKSINSLQGLLDQV